MWEIKKYITNDEYKNKSFIRVSRYSAEFVNFIDFSNIPTICIHDLIHWIEETDDNEYLNEFSYIRLKLIEYLEYYSYSNSVFLEIPESLYSYLLLKYNLEEE